MSPRSKALLKGLFVQDETGKVYLRVTTSEQTEGAVNAVTTTNNRSLESLLSRAIVLDKKGNPCLNLMAVSYGMTVYEGEQKKRIAGIEAQSKAKAVEQTTEE